MNKTVKTFGICLSALAMGVGTPAFCLENNSEDSKVSVALVSPQIFKTAKKNDYWKVAYLTGKHAQIVFMSISPNTNPKNEIGMETHEFDQIIFVVEGRAKSILNEETSTVEAGDMIFIPQGTPHNVINLSKEKSLKIISIYSSTDIPAKTIYKKLSDAKND